MKRLCKYRWPGDVAELQSVIERAVTSAREPILEIDAGLLDEGLPLGFYRLIEKSRRRYGGYLAHVGICVMAVAIAVSATLGTDRTATLQPMTTA